MTVRQRVDEALEALKTGLNPFVATQMTNVYRHGWSSAPRHRCAPTTRSRPIVRGAPSST